MCGWAKRGSRKAKVITALRSHVVDETSQAYTVNCRGNSADRNIMRAFALMRHARDLEAAYRSRSRPMWEPASSYLHAVRSALGAVPATSYRGIGRYPFTEYAEPDLGWSGERSQHIADPEPYARELLLRLLGPEDYETPYPRAFLALPQHAREVYSALAAPERYEIVELCKAPDRPRDLLGFDIGYWGGGNYSILCDTAIWPEWHPAPPDSIAALSEAMGQLNRNALFPNPEQAERFLEWYRQQPWAESEPSEFSIIAVGAWVEGTRVA